MLFKCNNLNNKDIDANHQVVENRLTICIVFESQAHKIRNNTTYLHLYLSALLIEVHNEG